MWRWLFTSCLLFIQMEGLCVCSMSCLRVVQFSSLSPQDGYLVSWLGWTPQWKISHDSHMSKHHSMHSHMTVTWSGTTEYMISHMMVTWSYTSPFHSPFSPLFPVGCQRWPSISVWVVQSLPGHCMCSSRAKTSWEPCSCEFVMQGLTLYVRVWS